MTRYGLGIALSIFPLPLQAAAITLPLVYAGCPSNPADPTRIEISEGTKGVVVIYRRAGADPGPFETYDVNLARISRRLFFTLRTGRGLVEFQGHAGDDRLNGRISDDGGAARPISLAANHGDTFERCDAVPEGPK